MKSKWPCFVFIFTCIFTNAQTNLDSLYTVWQDKTKTDSLRAQAYSHYIWNGFLYKKPDSAFILAEELVAFAQDKHLFRTKSWAYNLQGISFYIRGNYPQALKYHRRSLKINEGIGDKEGIATSLANIANGYQVQGYYPQALDYNQRSLKIYKEIENKIGIAQLLNNIGNIYGMQRNYPQALDYFEHSLKIKKELKDKRGVAKSLGNIGVVYYEQGNFAKAMDFYNRSLKSYEEIEDQRGIAISLYNIGVVYSDKDNYPQALDYYHRCLKIYKEIEDTYGISETLQSIGEDYNSQNMFNQAITECQKSLQISEEIGAIDLQKEACSCLYEAHKALGNGNKALVFHERMLVLNDSLQSEETSKKLQQMEFKKQVVEDSLLQVEKDLLIEMAHQTEVRKKDKNRNIALGVGMFFLLLSGGFYSRWRYVKKSKGIIEKEKDRSDNLLLNILPSEIAEELKAKGSADARDYEEVSILFTDFKGFTQASEKLTAKELIEEINVCFKAFDYICETYGIEKIKTIGDSYMAAGGLPVPSADSIKNTVLAALEMQSFISNRILEKDELNEISFKMRLGIHTGHVVAGIVGVKKFQYDIWGDTVNTASRMESSGEIGKVNISESTYAFIKNDPDFTFEPRGKIDAKGKGEMEMYFVEKN